MNRVYPKPPVSEIYFKGDLVAKIECGDKFGVPYLDIDYYNQTIVVTFVKYIEEKNAEKEKTEADK